MRHLLIFLCFAVLSACAPRAELILFDDPVVGTMIEPVFVGTTRAYVQGQFTDARVEQMNFARLDVSIPPDRNPGEIEFSSSNPDPSQHFLFTSVENFEGAAGFRDGLSEILAQRPRGSREVLVFVHGYNNTFAESVFRTAQIRSDFNVPGVAVNYAWPSAGHPLGYVYDRDSILFARDGLERLLDQVFQAGADNVVLVAHSMGGQLLMEALRSIAIGPDSNRLDRLGGVILMSPDIDIEVFRSQALRINPLPQPFVIFVSQRDRVLRLSSRISGQNQRLGNIGTIEDVADLEIALVDITEFSGGAGDRLGHSTSVTSPAMIQVLSRLTEVDDALQTGSSSRIGLFQGTALTVRNLSQVILSPLPR